MKIKYLIAAAALSSLFSSASLANTYGCMQIINNTNALLTITNAGNNEIYYYGLSSSALWPGQSATVFLSAYGSGHSYQNFSISYGSAGQYPSMFMGMSVNHGAITLDTSASNPTANFRFSSGSAIPSNNCPVTPVAPGAETYPFTINTVS